MKTWISALQRKGRSVLFQSYVLQGYMDSHYQESLCVSRGVSHHHYIDGWVMLESAEFGAFKSELGKKLKNEVYIDFFIAHCKLVSEELFDLGNQLFKKTFDDASLSSLLSEFMNLTSRTVRVIPFLTTLAVIQKDIENQLSEALSKVFDLPFDSEELKSIIQDLMLKNEKMTHVTQSIKDLRELIDYVSEHESLTYNGLKERFSENCKNITPSLSKELLRKMNAYLEEYDFLPTDYYVGTPTTINQLLDQMAVFICNKNSQKTEQSPLLSYDELLLGDFESKLLSKVQDMHFIRQHRIEALFKSGRQARGLLTEIGQRLGLTYEETIYMTYNEIVESLIASELSIDYSIIADRMIDYGLVMEDRVIKYITSEELTNAKSKLPVKVESSNKLTGETAYNGKCSGEAYVVDDLVNIEGMRHGNILVAPMTSPYHVSAMMIADAVLTNEGGILSHAAIICRELKIPCIVGLKNATTIIKSGDNLSVNAESSVGIVEILDSTPENWQSKN
ncbi:MAG: hypothetical protein LBC73_02165 [Oscillospiraceae bacterium]|jgi:phosphoenolpyruvate synthase/pyruvate phosphate dikinase|nr:hypothetical protein [Oscillospiraceae bacterium]